MISIVDAGPFQCRWIEGDDDQCCGVHTLRGSWCEDHRAIVFRPMYVAADRDHSSSRARKNNMPQVHSLMMGAE